MDDARPPGGWLADMSTDPVAPGDVASQPEDPNPEQHAGDPAGDTQTGTAIDAHTATLESNVDPKLF